MALHREERLGENDRLRVNREERKRSPVLPARDRSLSLSPLQTLFYGRSHILSSLYDLFVRYDSIGVRV